MIYIPLARISVAIEAKKLAFRSWAGLGKAEKHEYVN